MEIKIVELGDNYVKMIVKGEDHIFLNLLQYYLATDKRVVLAKYNIPHPLVGEPELYVRTNGANPIDVIKDANKKIIEVCEELLKQI